MIAHKYLLSQRILLNSRNNLLKKKQAHNDTEIITAYDNCPQLVLV